MIITASPKAIPSTDILMIGLVMVCRLSLSNVSLLAMKNSVFNLNKQKV